METGPESDSAAAAGPQQVHTKAGEGPCTLFFAPSFGKRDLRLFEVPEEVLQRVLEGQELQLIGELNKDAVLCTSNKTYAMKKVETSNQMYLLESSETSVFPLTSRTSDYYEIKPTAPRLEQIEALLLPTQYNGAEDEQENPPDPSLLLGRAELISRVQASREELQAALRSLGVVELDGKMRLVSKAAVGEVARNLLDTIMENGWALSQLYIGDGCSQAMGVDPVLLSFVLSTLGTQSPGEIEKWDLSTDAVARVSAHGLFLAHTAASSKPWELQDFLLTWAARTPGIEAPDAALLAGICVKLTRTDSPEVHLHYCPVDTLGPEASLRLAALFSIKPKFSVEELEPYLAEFATGGNTVTDIALAHARLVDGLYIAR